MSRICERRTFATGSLLVLATLLCFCCGTVRAAQAINYSWNAAADGVWSNQNNWSPVGVPTINDNVNFDTTSQHNCTIDGTDLAFSLTIANNYVGTLSFAAGGSLTVNGQVNMSGGTIDVRGATTPATTIVFGGVANSTIISGGTFECGSKLVIFGGAGLQVTGGTVNATDTSECRLFALFQSNGVFNGSKTLTTCVQNWQRIGGTFNHENGTVGIGNSNNIQTNLDPGGAPFNFLSLVNGGNTIFLQSDLTVLKDFVLHNQFQASAHNVTVTGMTTSDGGNFFAQSGTMNLNGGLICKNGGGFSGGDTGSIVNVTDVTIMGNPVMNGPVGSISLLGGTMNVSGDWFRTVNTATGAFSAGTSNIAFVGSGTQSLDTGGAANGGGDFYVLNHSGTGTLQLVNNALTADSALALTAGTLDANSQNIIVLGQGGGIASIADTANAATVLKIPAGTATFSSGLSMMGGQLQSIGGTYVLGGDISATNSTVGPSTIQGILNLGGTNRTLTVNGSTSVLSVSAAATNGGVIKAGPGKLILSGTSNYTNNTSINAGTLQLDGTLSSSNVQVNSTGILTGTGTMSTLQANAGSIVSPGDAGIGALTTNASATFAAGSTLTLELSGSAPGTFDQIVSKGNLALGGTLALNVGSFTTTPATKFVLLDNQSANAVAGTFSGVAEGSAVNVNGQAFTITYAGGTGNDVGLIAPNVAPAINTAPTATPAAAGLFQPVSFSVGATDPNGDTLTFAWTFGDSTSGTGANPTHAYSATGTYTATVTVSDGHLTASATVQIVVANPDYSVRLLAGVPPNAIEGTGSAARFNGCAGVAVDGAGNVYVGDTLNHTIRKLTPAGGSSTIAGRAGVPGTTDGTPDVARFNSPDGVALDAAGNLYVADSGNHCIRMISATDGSVSTFAGQAGTSGFTNGAALSASFNSPSSVTVAASGNIYVADTLNNAIRMITPAPNAMVTTVAGQGFGAANQGINNGPIAAAKFTFPSAVAVTGSGDVYVADTSNHLIRKISGGTVSTFAGSTSGFVNDPVGTNAKFFNPRGIVLDASENLFIGDVTNHAIRMITPSSSVTTYAGGTLGFTDGTGVAAKLGNHNNLAIDSAGTLYAADSLNSIIRKITPDTVVTTLAGAGSRGNVDGNPGLAASSASICMDSSGTIYVAFFGDSTIRKISPTGTITLLAGQSGVAGSADGVGAGATFKVPQGICVDSQGIVYVADTGNQLIRKILPDGTVSTIAGTVGVSGHADMIGTAASFNSPVAIAVDENGILYVSDANNFTIRRIDTSNSVTTLAGQNLTSAYVNDPTGANARFSNTAGIVYAGGGVLYISDAGNGSIRRVTTGGAVTTYAGTGVSGTPVDGLAASATFRSPSGLGLDSSGNLFVVDGQTSTIRKVTNYGSVLTIAGKLGVPGYVDGIGPVAHFNQSIGVAVGPQGQVYIADSSNNAIRIIELALKDKAAIDLATAPIGHVRQLSVSQLSATSFAWTIQRRPFGSSATFSDATKSNPVFAADVVGLYTFQVTAVGAAGSATTTVDFVASASSNVPPVAGSAPVAAPNPASPGQIISFTTSATDGDGDILSYTWNFGDGTTGTGTSTTHAYAAVGTYTASVLISDGIAAPIDGGSVQVIVAVGAGGGGGGGPLAAVLGTGIDTDGDGFSDSFENAVGTNPNDINSTPTGKPLTAGDILPLTVSKVRIKLNFAKATKDTITLSGSVSVPNQFNPLGQKLIIDVGEVIKSFTLTAKGVAKTTDGTVRFTFKAVKKIIVAQNVKFIVTLAKGNYAATLANSGFTNATAKKVPTPVQITVVFNGNVAQKIQTLKYTATKGKTGSAM